MRVFRIALRPSLAASGRKSYYYIGQPRSAATSVAFSPLSVLTFRLYSKQSTSKSAVAMSTTATTLKGQPLDRPALDAMLRRRLFYTPSFEVRLNTRAPNCSPLANC
jgi:glycyl-tRNA synthetase